MADGDAMQAYRMAQTLPGCLGERFLGRKTLAQKACRVGLGGVLRPLLRAQNACGKCHAVARAGRLDARNVDDVGADAENHAVSNAFIFFTACSRPMNTASAMMA